MVNFTNPLQDKLSYLMYVGQTVNSQEIGGGRWMCWVWEPVVVSWSGDCVPVVPVGLDPLFITSFLNVHSCLKGAHTCLHLQNSCTTPSIPSICDQSLLPFVFSCCKSFLYDFFDTSLDSVYDNALAGWLRSSYLCLHWQVRIFFHLFYSILFHTLLFLIFCC